MHEPLTDFEEQSAGAVPHPGEMRASVAFRVGNSMSLTATVRTTPAGLVTTGIMVAAINLSVARLVRTILRPG